MAKSVVKKVQYVGLTSDTVSLSIILSTTLAKESNLESEFDVESSSLIVTLLSDL
jgi:hypothetical protein